VKPSFNTAGPCFPDEHYMLPPERRLGRVMELVDDGKYFTLVAGRQTGKTTSARWLVHHYRAGQRFRAIWVDVQEAREQPDPAKAFRGEYAVANPIYREVIPRALTSVAQHGLHQPTEWYVRPDGSLDMEKIVSAFQAFWRKDGHLAAEGFGNRESGPHLMLMAFLQRIVNGGGRIDREYALGRGDLDLLVTWKEERHAIEVKLRRDTETEGEALDQVARYLDQAGLDEGWLVMFDLRSTRPWSERITRETVEHAGKRVHVAGC
jgi:hypothetical protein